MDQRTKAHITGSIATMSAVQDEMKSRLAELNNALEVTMTQRESRLNGEIARLVPDLSKDSHRRVTKAYRNFGSDDFVTELFETNRKFLGIFKTPSYNSALTVLQAKFKLFLEKSRFVQSDDIQIENLSLSKKNLEAQREESARLVTGLELAQNSVSALPSSIITGVKSLAVRRRDATTRSRMSARQWVETQRLNAATPEESDDDLLLWALTGFPTSGRTFLLDMVTSHEEERARYQASSQAILSTSDSPIIYDTEISEPVIEMQNVVPDASDNSFLDNLVSGCNSYLSDSSSSESIFSGAVDSLSSCFDDD